MADPVNGNAEAIDALEHALQRARQGNVGYVVVTSIESFQGGATAFAGGSGGAGVLEGLAVNLLREHANELERRQLNFTLPDRNPLLGADYVCYNAARWPLNFDFIAWLVDAEMTRVREGAPAPLKVGFFWGRDGKAGCGTARREQFFQHVVRPSLALIGAVEDPVAADGRHKSSYVLRDVVAAARRGEAVPRLRTPERVVMELPRPPYVTITLREADHWPGRNSNLAAWIEFALHLHRQGERVVFVRDTAKAQFPLGIDAEMDRVFPTSPAASTDLHYRMALYERAKTNLFTSNGPWSLALFSDRPWLMFVPVCGDDDPYRPNTPTFWRESSGVEQFGQYPWSRPDQRIVWSRTTPADDYETLVAAWDELAPQLAQAA